MKNRVATQKNRVATQNVSVSLDKAVLAWIDRQAKLRHLNRSRIVNDLVYAARESK